MAVKKISGITPKAEKILAASLLCLILVLVLGSAVTKIIGVLINWVQSIALLAFAQLTFLDTDVVARSGQPTNTDMLTDQLPKVVQKLLGIVFDIVMLLFLFISIAYGFLLVSQSWNRMFNILKPSYAWRTPAVPVETLLLLTMATGMLVGDTRKPAKDREWRA